MPGDDGISKPRLKSNDNNNNNKTRVTVLSELYLIRFKNNKCFQTAELSFYYLFFLIMDLKKLKSGISFYNHIKQEISFIIFLV